MDDTSPNFLTTPFTAEEIREEWIQGFSITLRRQSNGEENLQRWTVVAADQETVTIEFAVVDDSGAVIGEPRRNQSTWEELRDHARFPAPLARREQTQRTTTLGEFEGWLYTVENPEEGTLSEFFFAHSKPGAPLWMRTLNGDVTVAELEQIARHRPEE